MTSVLATGAVANADTVNVTADPGKLINLVGLKSVGINNAATSSRTALGESEELSPIALANKNTGAHYTIDLEVLDEQDTLKQVAVCLFDSNVLSGSDVATTCGSGFDSPDTVTNTFGAQGTGVFRPQSALQMAFLPGAEGSNNAIGDSAQGLTDHSGSPSHLIRSDIYNPASNATSLITQKDDFKSSAVGTSGDNHVWDLSFRFGLSNFAHNSSFWKVRVVATYDAGTDPDQVVELIDTETYTVGYFGTFDTVERQSQAFGNVIDGGSKEITGITTGEYYANFASDISIEASAFEDTSNTALPFGTTASPAAGEISMKCVGTTSGTEQFMADATAKKLLDSVPANSSETTASAALARKVADTHDCTVYIGDNVATGAYDNVITVAIGKEQ